MRGAGVRNISVSGFTLTSEWNGRLPEDPTMNNPEAGGPVYGIVLRSDAAVSAERNSFERVTVEKFRRMGFRLDAGSRDNVIKNCTARNATDTGAGGSGYGFVLQGNHPAVDDIRNPNAGTVNDTCFNAVIGCKTDGISIRHSVLIQYYAHNNLVTGCDLAGSRYGAIDLHGEDEYQNEISFNTIRNMPAGGAIELGNSGATHDRSGPGNWIHHNTIINCLDGIRVEYGTQYALIENNDISGNTFANGSGIKLGYCSFITVRANKIHDNRGPGFAGIRFVQNRASNDTSSGSPLYCLVTGNDIY